uniref:Uncharacterized protein n=1 Tax=Arundo donax TaxID=35708 RepID=A0A0A9F600_ARUDO
MVVIFRGTQNNSAHVYVISLCSSTWLNVHLIGFRKESATHTFFSFTK